MTFDLEEIFGEEIVVNDEPRQAEREFTGFSGASGMTSMFHGTRGKVITVSGIIRGSGLTYSSSRQIAWLKFEKLESLMYEEAHDYTFKGQEFYDVVWNEIKKIPNSQGGYYSFTSQKHVIVKFIMTGMELI